MAGEPARAEAVLGHPKPLSTGYPSIAPHGVLHFCSAMAANDVSDDPSSHAPVVAFPDFRLFDSAQDILDHNKCVRGQLLEPKNSVGRCQRDPASFCPCRRLIKEIKANHEAQTPEALARNCVLIRELNTNISAVRRE